MKSFVLFLVSCLALVSCQKEFSYEVDPGTTGGGGGGSSSGGGGNSTYYIKGKKDGTAFSFSANTQAKVSDYTSIGAGMGLAMIAGASVTSMETLSFSMSFLTASAIPSSGTFTETDNGFDHVVLGIYTTTSTAYFYNAGNNTPTTTLPLSITITAKTSTEIKGSFQGAFYKTDATGTPYTDHVTFTEGTFDLPLK